MKKCYLILALCTIAMFGIAQDENEKMLRPAKNNFSFEVDFMPFNLDKPIVLNSFRGRYFFSEKLALKIGFNFENVKNVYETPANTPDDIMLFNESEEKFNVMGLQTGIEYHFLNSRKLSPYVGIDIGFENKTSCASYKDYTIDYYYYDDYEVITTTTEISNAWETSYYIDQWGNLVYINDGNERAYTSYGVNLLLGADIYIIKHLYLGFEIGLGAYIYKYKEIEVKVDEKVEQIYPESTANNYGLNVNNAIRLGVWF